MKRERKPYLSQFYKENKLPFFLAVMSSLLTAALNLGIVWVLQQMIDTISGVPGAFPLATLVWMVIGILLLIAGIKGLHYVSKPRFMQKAMQQYKNYAFQKVTQKTWATFRTENTANYLSAFSNDVATIEKGYLENQFDIMVNLVTFTGSLIMMLLYSPIMTVISCCFFILPIGVSLLTGNRVEKVEQKISDRNRAFVATLQDSLSGFSVMKSFKAETAMMTLFTESNHSVEQAKCEKRKLLTCINMWAGIAGVVAQFGTFLTGAWLILSGWDLTPGILIIFIELTANIINPVQQFPEQFASRKAAVALIDKLAATLHEPLRDDGMHIPPSLSRGIEMRDVSFDYQAGDRTLCHMTARFEKGKSYAIVGASGSGKSTLLGLLMAHYGQYAGDIYYDGYELRQVSHASLYDLISVIQQHVFIFHASIWDNITMFHDFPHEEVAKAIALSGLSDLVKERGENYDCGENGQNLSGGEKQRIAIARSLLKKSQVLFVDEATSALDAATAYQISCSLLALQGMTRIVVTHNLDANVLKQFDGILTLKNGRIEETGTFTELMERKQYFYSLFTVSQ